MEDQSFKDISSPKKSIQKAFESGIIADGQAWIEMQEDRGSMSHMYSQIDSEKIFENIRDKYAKTLNDLVIALEKELSKRPFSCQNSE